MVVKDEAVLLAPTPHAGECGLSKFEKALFDVLLGNSRSQDKSKKGSSREYRVLQRYCMRSKKMNTEESRMISIVYLLD